MGGRISQADGHLQGVGRWGLLDADLDLQSAGAGTGVRRRNLELGCAGSIEPLREEHRQAAPALLLERPAQIVPAGAAEPVLAPEPPQARVEAVRAEQIAQHQEHVRRLVVADDLRGAVTARGELAQGEVLARRDGGKVAQPVQPHGTRGLCALLLLVEVVGHEGRQPLAPVAALVVDVHAVAPPVVQHLVPQRGGLDERQPQHVDPKIGQRGHAEPGWQGAGHHAELAEGVGADLIAVQADVAFHRLQVLVGEIVQLGMEPGAQPNRLLAGPHHASVRAPRRARPSARCLRRGGRTRTGPGSRPRRPAPRQAPGDQAALSGRKLEVDAIGELMLADQGIPSGARGQIAARGAGHGRQLLQRVAVIGLWHGRQLPGVTQDEAVHGAAAPARATIPASRLRGRAPGRGARRRAQGPATIRSARRASRVRPPPSSVICALPRNARAAGSSSMVRSWCTDSMLIGLGRHGGAKRQAHASPRSAGGSLPRRKARNELQRLAPALHCHRQPGARRLPLHRGDDIPGLLHRYARDHDDHISRVHARALRDAVLDHVRERPRSPLLPSSITPRRGRSGAAVETAGRPNTASARPAVSVLQSSSASQGSSTAACAMPRSRSWCGTPKPFSQMAAAHDAHDQRRRGAGAALRDGLRHGAVPQLHALDEAQEGGIVRGSGSARLARGILLRQMLEIGLVQRLAIACRRRGRIAHALALRLGGMRAQPRSPTRATRSRSTLSAIMGTRCMRAKSKIGMYSRASKPHTRFHSLRLRNCSSLSSPADPLVEHLLHPAREHLEPEHQVGLQCIQPGDRVQLPAVVLGVVVALAEQHDRACGELRQAALGARVAAARRRSGRPSWRGSRRLPPATRRTSERAGGRALPAMSARRAGRRMIRFDCAVELSLVLRDAHDREHQAQDHDRGEPAAQPQVPARQREALGELPVRGVVDRERGAPAAAARLSPAAAAPSSRPAPAPRSTP